MLKPIPPTLRERNRYLAFEVISDSNPKRDEIIRAIHNLCLGFLGELGTSKAGLWLMDWDDRKKRGILKVTHRSVEEVRASLVMVKEINRSKCILRILGVSGTVKTAKEKYLLS